MQLAGTVQFSRTMAAPISAKRLLLVCALVVVVAMLAAHRTEANDTGASNFVFFSGPCSGDAAVLDACGCNTIPSNTRGGYKFTFAGQWAAAYNEPSCTGQASMQFEGFSNGQCYPLGWQSVFIQC